MALVAVPLFKDFVTRGGIPSFFFFTQQNIHQAMALYKELYRTSDRTLTTSTYTGPPSLAQRRRSTRGTTITRKSPRGRTPTPSTPGTTGGTSMTTRPLPGPHFLMKQVSVKGHDAQVNSLDNIFFTLFSTGRLYYYISKICILPIANQTFILVITVNLMRRIYTDALLSTPDLKLFYLF